MTVDEIAEGIARRADAHEGQCVVAIAGPPASGKSTLTQELAGLLEGAIVLPMDGFHLDNAVLEDRGLTERKGAPETFDVAGLAHLLERLRGGQEVLAPLFDRELDLSRGAAVAITSAHKIVLVEGNYLLLDEAPWSGLHGYWDMTIMLEVPQDVLKERLVHRWLSMGMGVERATAKAMKNDLPNGARGLAGSVTADLVVSQLAD
jgi:pantothenate kinase